MFKPSPQNYRKPKGFGGRIVVSKMNKHHESLAEWGFSFAETKEGMTALDIGCGGGRNIQRMLACPDSRVCGVDYSAVSVRSSRRLNALAVRKGRCVILEGNVSDLPFGDSEFDLVTAFETVYYWPNMVSSFRQVLRVLKDGGSFLICNEADGEHPVDEKYAKMIDGMTIYRKDELSAMLTEAGFADIEIRHVPEKDWLCVISRKPLR